MEKRPLGQSGIEISPLGLGTVKFGRNQGVKYPEGFDIPDEAFLADLLTLAKSLGINMLDTAPAYGVSEERLGRLLKGQRKDWVIVGKVGEEFENGESAYIFTADHFKYSLERSLKRLQTDYIDALLIHSNGADMEILQQDDLIRTMHDFKDQGLVKAIGASTKTIDGGIKTLELMDIVMAMYNPIETTEKPVLDYAAQHNKAALLKKAFASGHLEKITSLSSRRRPGSGSHEPQDSGLRRSDNTANPVQTCMDFAFAHPALTHGGVIIGTINPENLKANANAIQHSLNHHRAA